MLNNYFKIELPLISKNYFKYNFGDKGKYKYRGTAYIIFEKSTEKIVFNTLILDENQEIFGADNGKFGKDYGIKKKQDVFDYRKKSFDYSIPVGRKKNTSKFSGDINYLNKLILRNNLTIKDVDGFISGSNSSGGIKNPEMDPVRLYFWDSDPIIKIYDENLKFENIEWKFFSLISNIAGNFRNSNFSDEITIDYLDKMEEKSIDWLLKSNLMFMPYGKAEERELHIPFGEAFASQNYEVFKKPEKSKAGIIAQSDTNFKKMDSEKFIMNIAKRGNKEYLTKQLRAIWRKIIDDDIKSNNYNVDFVTGTKQLQRAHIIENSRGSYLLMSNKFTEEQKKEFIKDILNPNNYILLTNNIHNAWDKGQIIIKSDGEIHNESMPIYDFTILIGEFNNIYSIYHNVLNNDRKELLIKRINQ